MVHRSRHIARSAALRLGCAVALVACAAHADGTTGKTVSRSRAAEGIYAVVTVASGAADSTSELRLPIFTLTLPPAASFVPAMQVGAHMTVTNQPRMGSAVVLSASVPF